MKPKGIGLRWKYSQGVMMIVSEIFYSVQGEGPNMGTPSVFLRLTHCNLRCSFCDSKYTWKQEEIPDVEQTGEFTPEEVREKLIKYGCPNLVITGGEPLVQQRELEKLLPLIRSDFKWIEMETNGSLNPSDTLVKYINLFIVSPKMENSGNLKESRENPEVLHFYGAPGARAVFKFVVGNETDLQEVTEFVTKYQIPKAKVFLMPEGILRDDILDKSEWIIEKCKELGYRFSTRLHVLIWNNKRKV